MKHVVALICALWVSASPAFAIETVVDSFDDKYHLEHYRVEINNVFVSEDASVYLAADETIYVSDSDLDTWNLKRRRNAAFERDGHRYFGLQTDLNLATSYNRHDNTIEIVAPSSAFRGQLSDKRPAPTTPGRGGFFNYDLDEQRQSYDFYAVSQGGVYQLKYLSTTSTEFRFFRSMLRWFQTDSITHRAISIGDANTNGGFIGSSIPFAGVHYATDYTTDPTFVSSSAPSVSGFASSPSLLEVFINNVLEVQRYVPEGPFTVDNLPTYAANSDIVLVLTDQRGVKSTQEVRPSFAPTFLGRGFSEFRIDGGVAKQNVNLPTQYYRGFVGQANLRYGLSDAISADVLGETINANNFVDAGLDVQLAQGNSFTFRLGTGNIRRASDYRLNLQSGQVALTEIYGLNSQTMPSVESSDSDNVVQNLTEQTNLTFSVGERWSFQLSFQRGRSNQNTDQSNLSNQISTNIGNFRIGVEPMYDFVSHRYSANARVDLQLDKGHSVSGTSAITESGQTSAGISWKKMPVDPNDPIAMNARLTSGQTQAQEFGIEDTMPWAVAAFDWQRQFNQSIYNPQLKGALALVGGNVYALQTIGEGESFGILQVPGGSDVRVQVNGSDAGTTNGQGWLLLRNLQPYRENRIDVNGADLPIWYNLDDPLAVIPRKSTPIRVNTLVASRGGFTFEAVDARGVPLAAASSITSGTERYPVGYGGYVYVAGMAPGAAQFKGVVDGEPCRIDVIVPKDTTTIPDLGPMRCL